MSLVTIFALFAITVNGDIFDTLAIKSAIANCPYLNNLGSFCPIQDPQLPMFGDPLPGRIGIPMKFTQQGSITFGLPVVEMTYKGSGAWNGFILPDNAIFTPGTSLQNPIVEYTNFYGSVDDLFNIRSLIREHYAGGSVTACENIADIYRKYFGTNNVSTLIQEYDIAYQLSMSTANNTWTQDPIFALFEQNLPQTYDPIAYQKLLDYFGTNVVVMANFGGIVDQRVTANKTLDNIDPQYFLNDTRFELMITAHPDTYRGARLANDYLHLRMPYPINEYGGDPKATTWEAKIPTLNKFQVMMDFVVLSLDNFIHDTQKKANTVKAITEYNNGVLVNWQQQIQQAKQQKNIVAR